MNFSRVKVFGTHAVVVLIGMVLATAAAYFVLEEIVFPMKQKPPMSQESFESITQVRGMVSLVEMGGSSGAAVAVILSDVAGEKRRVLVPRGEKGCKSADIIDPALIAVGDVLDVRGESLENGDVFPCQEREHHVIKVSSSIPQTNLSSSSASSTRTGPPTF